MKHDVAMFLQQAVERGFAVQAALPFGQGAVNHGPGLAVQLGDPARIPPRPGAVATLVSFSPAENQIHAEPGWLLRIPHTALLGQQPRQG